MSWVYLGTAIVFGLAGITSLKLSEGLVKAAPTGWMLVFYALSLAALARALRYIDVSVAYAIWSGVGTAAVAIIGVIWFKESITTLEVFSILAIIAGVVGLKLSDRRL
jgi:small multidrug resistance pump